MRFDVGLVDRLFGKKTTLELPGPGGTLRTVSVSVKWLEKMQLEGRITLAPPREVKVHILDPGGPLRVEMGLSGSSEEYYVATWIVGEDISEDQCERFIDRKTDAIYAMTVYEKGIPKTSIVHKDLWDRAKSQMDSA